MSDELGVEVPEDTLDCEWVPRSAIEPNEWNPNEIDAEEASMLRKSILNHGWTRPIVVHAEELYIIDGEQRWTIARHQDIANNDELTPEDVPAGYVPVFGITVSEDEAKVSTVQHNRARGFVEYDSLYDYFMEFQADGELDSLMEELDMDDEQVLRIVERETVSEAVSRDHEPGRPWVPADISEFEDDEVPEGTTLSSTLRDSGDAVESERLSAVVTESEMEFVRRVLPEDAGSDVLVRYCRYLDEHDLVEGFRDSMDVEADEDRPHPEEVEAE